MVYKNRYGKIIEIAVLKTRYNTTYNSKNKKYDLPLTKNLISFKNVSVKSTKSNTIYCGDIFNFLESVSLELIVVEYKVLFNSNIKVLNYYLFKNLDEFFVNLNKSLDLVKLKQLKDYIKGLKWPFSLEQRQYCHKMARLIEKKNCYSFRVNCKLSSTNKRIQCSLKVDQLIKIIKPKLLDVKSLKL